MVAVTKETKKHCTLKKKLFPAIKHSNLQGKNVFRNNYFGSQSFPLSFCFTQIFVYLSVITAVYYFSVYKLIGGPQQAYTCSNSSAETLEKGVEYVQS